MSLSVPETPELQELQAGVFPSQLFGSVGEGPLPCPALGVVLAAEPTLTFGLVGANSLVMGTVMAHFLQKNGKVPRKRAFPGPSRHGMIHTFVSPLFLTHRPRSCSFCPPSGSAFCQWDFPAFQQTRDHSPVSPGNVQS